MGVSSDYMRAIEENAEYLGVSRLQLMENAGHAVAMEIGKRFDPKRASVIVYAGLGGNGGDGLVAARHLTSLNFRVSVVLAGIPDWITDVETKKNWQVVQQLGSIRTYTVEDSSQIPDVDGEVLIDALLGTGVKGALRPPVLQLVRKLNKSKGFRIAIDVPTGVNADTGEVVKDAVRAHLTVTLHKEKAGLAKAKRFVGELVVVEIGIPPEAELYAGPGDVRLVKKPRAPVSKKGDFGRLLIVGGSETFTGAPSLAGLAALRTGVDLVYIAAPRRTAEIIASFSPNLITVKLDGEHLNPDNIGYLESYLNKATAVILGPGLGLHPDTVQTVKTLSPMVEKRGLPLLLDADGLKAFSQTRRKFKRKTVLTPHAGEYKILLGESPPKDLSKRAKHVTESAKRLGACILLKGNVDVISDGINTKLNVTGNPGMTVGGTGDTLSGIIGAFLAQGFDPFKSAVAGAFINGAAGDFAAKEKGYHLVPTDIVDWIPKLIEDPMLHARLHRV
jgi:NAD(P)H-hydrate epimerase